MFEAGGILVASLVKVCATDANKPKQSKHEDGGSSQLK